MSPQRRVGPLQEVSPALVVEIGMSDHERVHVEQAQPQPFEERDDEVIDRACAPRVQEQPALAEEREKVKRSAAHLRLDPMHAFNKLHDHHSPKWNSEAPPSTSSTDPVMYVACGDEERDRLRHLLRRSHLTQRDHDRRATGIRRIGLILATRHAGVHDPRRHHVDPDPIRRELARHRACEHPQPGLRHADQPDLGPGYFTDPRAGEQHEPRASRSTISCAATCPTLKQPVRLMSRWACHCSPVTSRNGADSTMPALPIATSSGSTAAAPLDRGAVGDVGLQVAALPTRRPPRSAPRPRLADAVDHRDVRAQAGKLQRHRSRGRPRPPLWRRRGRRVVVTRFLDRRSVRGLLSRLWSLERGFAGLEQPVLLAVRLAKTRMIEPDDEPEDRDPRRVVERHREARRCAGPGRSSTRPREALPRSGSGSPHGAPVELARFSR